MAEQQGLICEFLLVFAGADYWNLFINTTLTYDSLPHGLFLERRTQFYNQMHI